MTRQLNTSADKVLRMLPFGARLGALFPSHSDANTQEGRSAERQRRIALSAAVSVIAKLLSVVVSLATVPLTIGYLGNERYGVWLTVTSVVGMMSFADLGIGNGLLTKIAEADGRGDQEALTRLVSSAFFMLLAVAFFLATATLIVAPLVDWATLFGVSSPVAREEVRTCLVLVAMNWFVAMPFSVVQRVQEGLQARYLSTVWTIFGTVLSLGGLLTATALRAGLPTLVLMLSGIPTLVIVLNFGWYFHRHPETHPRIAAFDRARATSLLRLGVLFTVLQLAGAVAYLSDNLVIARTLGADAVPDLAVPAKLFSLIGLPVSMIVAPLWPAYGEARARGDEEWIRRTLRRSIRSSIALAAIGGGLLVVVGPSVVRLWTRGSVSTGAAVLLPLAVWTCLSIWGQVVAAFLNGVSQIRAQAAAAVLMSCAAYGLKLLLVSPLGPGGVAWATVIAYVLFTYLPLSWVIRRALRPSNVSVPAS
jgi:O-antigen/teichoic acid export membrane protein